MKRLGNVLILLAAVSLVALLSAAVTQAATYTYNLNHLEGNNHHITTWYTATAGGSCDSDVYLWGDGSSTQHGWPETQTAVEPYEEVLKMAVEGDKTGDNPIYYKTYAKKERKGFDAKKKTKCAFCHQMFNFNINWGGSDPSWADNIEKIVIRWVGWSYKGRDDNNDLYPGNYPMYLKVFKLDSSGFPISNPTTAGKAVNLPWVGTGSPATVKEITINKNEVSDYLHYHPEWRFWFWVIPAHWGLSTKVAVYSRDRGGTTTAKCGIHTDYIDVTVFTNTPPTADAGPDQTVVDSDGDGSATVTLDGSGSSDPDGTIVSYMWRGIPGGFMLGTTETITKTLPVGTKTIQLEVKDNQGATDKDTVIVVIEENTPPTADAGADQTVTDNDGDGKEDVTLDGSGSSDPDGSIVKYEWFLLPIGEMPLIKEGVSTTWTLPVGTHTLRLTVTDDDGGTDTNETIVTVTDKPNILPIAKAGTDQIVSDSDGNGKEDVTLDGSGSSDEDGSIVKYEWFLLPIGELIFMKEGVSTTWTLPVGTHTLRLTVTDDRGGTGSDDIDVTVEEKEVDITPPTVVLMASTPSDGSIVQGATIKAEATDDIGIESCLLDDGTTNTTMVIADQGTPRATCTLALEDGDHTLKVWVADTSDNWAVSGERTILVDSTPPEKSTVTVQWLTGNQFKYPISSSDPGSGIGAAKFKMCLLEGDWLGESTPCTNTINPGLYAHEAGGNGFSPDGLSTKDHWANLDLKGGTHTSFWYKVDFSTLPPGNYFTKGAVMNRAGLWEDAASDWVTPPIDTLPPQVDVEVDPREATSPGTPAPAPGATVKVDCQDTDCDPDTYGLSFPEAGECPDDYAYYTLTTGELPVTQDTWVCAIAKDTSKNVGISEPIMVYASTSAPVTSITLVPATPTGKREWYNIAGVGATLSCQDSDGCDRIYYCQTTAPTCSPVGDGGEYSGDFFVGDEQDGNWTVMFQSVDTLGNLEEPPGFRKVNIDATKPEITLLDRDKDIPIFIGNVSDTTSGTYQVRYEVAEGSGLVVLTEYVTLDVPEVDGKQEIMFMVDTDTLGMGDYNVTIIAEDEAGNSGSITDQLLVGTGTGVTMVLTGLHNRKADTCYIYGESASGPEGCGEWWWQSTPQIAFVPGSWDVDYCNYTEGSTPCEPVMHYTAPFMIDEEGTVNLVYVTTLGGTQTAAIRTDTELPVVELKALDQTGGDAQLWPEKAEDVESVTLTLSATDEASGVAYNRIRWQTGPGEPDSMECGPAPAREESACQTNPIPLGPGSQLRYWSETRDEAGWTVIKPASAEGDGVDWGFVTEEGIASFNERNISIFLGQLKEEVITVRNLGSTVSSMTINIVMGDFKGIVFFSGGPEEGEIGEVPRVITVNSMRPGEVREIHFKVIPSETGEYSIDMEATLGETEETGVLTVRVTHPPGFPGMAAWAVTLLIALAGMVYWRRV